MTTLNFKQAILEGIPNSLPRYRPLDISVNHAPKRKKILTIREEKQALKNLNL